MKIKIDNWRDRHGNDLDKAKRLLADKSITNKQIVDVTGISKLSISNYRTGKTDIEKAKWSIVNKLAQMYDILEFTPTYGPNGENIIKFSKVLSEYFEENKEAYKDDPRFLEMIVILESIVTSDPYITTELMQPFFEKG